MFILGNFFIALSEVLQFGFWIYEWILIGRVVISWVNADSYNPIVQFLHRVTEPVLEPIRRFLPATPIDFSPMIVFILLLFLKQFLCGSLMDLGYRLR